MNVDEVIKDVDYRHVIQLFDLICASHSDPFVMTEMYCRMKERQHADNGDEYFILLQPIQILHRIENVAPQTAASEVDPVIFHWIAQMYLFALYSLGLTFRLASEEASPRWLYEHYSPLHETSLANAWEKIRLQTD